MITPAKAGAETSTARNTSSPVAAATGQVLHRRCRSATTSGTEPTHTVRGSSLECSISVKLARCNQYSA